VPLRALIFVLALLGCVGGVTPLQCAIDSDCGGSAFCFQGACFDGTRSCPKLQPSFSSINSRLLQVSCGSTQINCHAPGSDAVESGPSFAGHPYTTLVNAPAANRRGSAQGLILVKPGDPTNSFLLTKLRLTAPADPLNGPGQPASAPGSTCAESLSVIQQWIQNGAQDN